MEEMAVKNADELTASDNTTESTATYSNISNITFTRTVSIVVNSDDSRTITVTTTSNDLIYPATESYTVTFAVWE